MNPFLAAIIERCLVEGVIELNQSVTLYSDGRHLHGSSSCQKVREPINLTVRQIVDLDEPPDCACRGVMSSRIASVLAASTQAFANIDADHGGTHDTNWAGIWQRLSVAASATIWDRRELTYNPRLRRLYTRNLRAADTVARRSADRIGETPLLAAIAAQALEIPVNPDQALGLSIWGRRKRLHDPQHGRPSTGHERAYEEHLDRTLNRDDTVHVHVFPHRHSLWIDGIPRLLDPDLCNELGTLLWYRNHHVGQAAVVELPALVGRGLELITSEHQKRRIGVTARTDVDAETIETARILWTDENQQWHHFDEAVDAAQLL